MPFLDPEHQGTLRSALRYRPSPTGDQTASQPGPIVARKSRFHAQGRSTTTQYVPDNLDSDEESQPRYRARAPHPRQRTASPQPTRRFHHLFFVGICLLVMILGWVAISALGTWWQTTQGDWHYGRPRTFQTDAVVGHHDSTQNPSHFIAMNLNRHIVIIEIPGGDVAHSIVYSGPVLLGPGQDLTPVTLTFQSINHDGKIDMVVNVAGNQLVFFNRNGTFVTPAQNSAG